MSLYRGLFASFFGIPHVIIQFCLYETMKKQFAMRKMCSIDHIPYSMILTSSLISKFVASFCTYPHEVIRNSIQNMRNYTKVNGSMREVVRNIMRRDGIKGFYAGFTLNLLRILPNNSVMFVAYEYLTRFLSE